MTILDEIILHQKALVNQLQATKSIAELEKSNYFERKIISLKEKLMSDKACGVIAEFKRRSPSKPNIRPEALSSEIVPAYELAGAAACSILTNEKFFGGTDQDLTSIRLDVNLPLLRKEFIVAEYQVYETKAIGADLILLIAAALSPAETLSLAKLAKSLGLEILLELKDETELDHINPYVDFVGVNNRDLRNFKVDIGQSEKLASLIPNDFIKVSESGISKLETVQHLRNFGYKGFLMGEHFMVQQNPGLACQDFVRQL